MHPKGRARNDRTENISIEDIFLGKNFSFNIRLLFSLNLDFHYCESCVDTKHEQYILLLLCE